ncbi:MAG: hypothetical protein ACI8XM_002998, partial [Haloarculaceae archaeon]
RQIIRVEPKWHETPLPACPFGLHAPVAAHPA